MGCFCRRRFQSVIALPFTLPFRNGRLGAAEKPDNSGFLHGVAVGLFSAGFEMEVLADAQIEAHKKKSDDLNRSGVWSIVRHPK